MELPFRALLCLHFDTTVDTKITILFNTDTILCQKVQNEKLHFESIQPVTTCEQRCVMHFKAWWRRPLSAPFGLYFLTNNGVSIEQC